MTNKEKIHKIFSELNNLSYIEPDDVPNIKLYMDQVTTFMDENLADFKRSPEEKLLTKTMINNYTKNDVLPPPIKKKYSEDHMYLLIFIYYLKSVLCINDIRKVLEPMQKYFFDADDDSFSIKNIYEKIYDMQQKLNATLIPDVMKEYVGTKRVFEEVKDSEQREYLDLFAYIAALSFDVYQKKHLIEHIIDSVFSKDSEETSEN